MVTDSPNLPRHREYGVVVLEMHELDLERWCPESDYESSGQRQHCEVERFLSKSREYRRLWGWRWDRECLQVGMGVFGWVVFGRGLWGVRVKERRWKRVRFCTGPGESQKRAFPHSEPSWWAQVPVPNVPFHRYLHGYDVARRYLNYRRVGGT